ncbi:MAG: hypothetical protein OXG15_01440 [Gammaproteobacteria bacterium]|nr:hypothetical protein [Gammaproteobacteria bacterium]
MQILQATAASINGRFAVHVTATTTNLIGRVAKVGDRFFEITSVAVATSQGNICLVKRLWNVK